MVVGTAEEDMVHTNRNPVSKLWSEMCVANSGSLEESADVGRILFAAALVDRE